MVSQRRCEDTAGTLSPGVRKSFPEELNVVRLVGARNKVMKHYGTWKE